MLAVGCLIPFVTLASGAAVGSYLGGVHGGYVGAAAGFGVGVLIAGAGLSLLGWLRGGRSRGGE